MRGIGFQFRAGCFCCCWSWLRFALAGCASTESENASERPWNTPQGWENGLPSGMFDQYR